MLPGNSYRSKYSIFCIAQFFEEYSGFRSFEKFTDFLATKKLKPPATSRLRKVAFQILMTQYLQKPFHHRLLQREPVP